MAVATHDLESWQDFALWANARRTWIFRGQVNASWPLATSLDRLCEKHKIPGSERREAENALLRDFKRAFHHYSSNTPRDNDDLEWLALMQHHGAPTRLLDFTYSPFVAAYFAMEDADADKAKEEARCIAVWAVDMKWLRSASSAHFGLAGKVHAHRIHGYFGTDAEMIHRELLFDAPHVLGAMAANPFRLNERLRVQKGVFLAPGDVTRDFTSNFEELAGHDDPSNVVKLRLPAAERQEAIESLHYMNISRATLFPGLDGYAQSLAKYHHLFSRRRPWN